MNDLLSTYNSYDQLTISLSNYVEEIHSPYKTLLDYHQDGTLSKHGIQLMSYSKNEKENYRFNGFQLVHLRIYIHGENMKS